jgi:uncharacterized membrane protein
MKQFLFVCFLATTLLYISCETSRSATSNNTAAVATTTPPQAPELTPAQRDSMRWVEQKKAMKNRKANMQRMDAVPMQKEGPTPVTKQNPKM